LLNTWKDCEEIQQFYNIYIIKYILYKI